MGTKLLAITLAAASLASAQTPPAPDGCILKHVVYDAHPTDVWLSYGTRDGKEVKWLGSDKKGEKAYKRCQKWLREASPSRRVSKTRAK